MRFRPVRVVLLIGVLACASSASAASITIDFEGLTDGDAVTNQFAPAVTFSNALVQTAGVSLNEIDFPPHSGVNVVLDNGGPLRLDFATPIVSFNAFFTYVSPLTLSFFDTSSNLVGTVLSSVGNNTGTAGSAPPNEALGGLFADVAFLTITGDPNGFSFVVDDVSFEQAAVNPSVPEPATLLLCGIGCAAAALRRRAQL